MTYIIILNIILVLYMIKCYMYLVTLFQQNHYDLKKASSSFGSYYLRKKYQYYYYIFLVTDIHQNNYDLKKDSDDP